MSRIYICSPHRLVQENRAVGDLLTELDNDVYLPAEFCSSEDGSGDSNGIRRKCIEAINNSESVVCHLDDYGMDSAWELGYAERLGKRIIGLSLDHNKLNSARAPRPHTVWDNWMHGWKDHLVIRDFASLVHHLRAKTVYLSIPVRCEAAIIDIQEHLNQSVKQLHTPLTIINLEMRLTARESWHVPRHKCIEAIEESDCLVTYLDDYGMDSAWELGYAEGAGKQIIGLAWNADDLNGKRTLKPQTIWDYWMHGWKEHSIVQGLDMLSALFDNSKDFKVPVICPIIERRNHGSVEILIQERVKDSDKKYFGVIEIPGGKILKNETIADALSREVKEECGLDVIPIGPLSGQNSYNLFQSKADLFEPFAVTEETGDHSFIGIFAVCRVVGGELRPTSEGRNQRWISIGELDHLLNTEAILPVIAPGLTKYLHSMIETVLT